MPTRSALAVFGLIALLGPGMAQSGSPAETAIREALAKWTSDFNAGETREICNLFAPAWTFFPSATAAGKSPATSPTRISPWSGMRYCSGSVVKESG